MGLLVSLIMVNLYDSTVITKNKYLLSNKVIHFYLGKI